MYAYSGIKRIAKQVGKVRQILIGDKIEREGLVWFLYLIAYQPGGDKGVHTFPKDISWKVNVIAQLEFELAYYNSTVQQFNHYTAGTHSKGKDFSMGIKGLVF